MTLIPRRLFTVAFLTSLFISFFPLFASEIPTKKCTKLGQTTIYKNRKFTCIRKRISGKWQLSWDNGVAIPKPSPSVSAVVTANPNLSEKVNEIGNPSSTTQTINEIEIKVAKSNDLEDGKNLAVSGRNRFAITSGYILFRATNEIIAMSDACTHNGCAVKIDKTGLLCPCHNALFNKSNGEVIRGPAAYALDRVKVYERDGFIYILD